MTPVEWFGVGGGAAAYLYGWRYFAGRIAWSEKSSSRPRPDSDDIVWGILCGFVIASLFPAVALYDLLRRRGAVTRFWTFMTDRILYTPDEWRDQ